MIGNQNLAATIADLCWDEMEDLDDMLPEVVLAEYLPEGWTYLGSGLYRHAFRGPDGCVYKVLTSYAQGVGGEANESQYNTWETIKSRAGDVFGVPECDLFTDSNVLVQEFVEGVRMDMEDDESFRVISKIKRQVGRCGFLLDVHHGNFLMVNNFPVLFDW